MLKKYLLSALCVILLLAGNSYALVNFDDIDDFIEVPSTASVNGQSQVSFSVWIKTDTLDSTNRQIYQEPRDPNVAQSRFALDISNTNVFRFGGRAPDSDSFTTWHTSTVSLSTNTWYCVVAVFDATNNLGHIYVNGVDESSAIAGDAFSSGDPVEADIGRRSDGVNFWGGDITEMAMWHGIALGQSDVDLLCSSGSKRMVLQTQPDSIAFYLPLDDGSDGTASCFNGIAGFKDLSGNSNNGIGNDGPNNTGLTCKKEEILSYPPY